MKLIGRLKLNTVFKKHRTKTIAFTYIAIVSLAAGYAYAQKINERKEIIQSSNETVRQATSEKDSLVVRAAFESCNEQFFLKYDNDDFLAMLKNDSLKESWKYFFAKNIRIKETPKACISLLKTLAKHNIKSAHFYSVHDLLHSEDLKKVEEVISTGIISNLILTGSEEQLRAVLARVTSKTDDVNVAGYSLYQHMVKGYFTILDKMRPVLNTPLGEIPEKNLESYIIGKSYALCGFNGPVMIKYGKNPNDEEFQSIEPCFKNPYSARITIVAMDENWLEINSKDFSNYQHPKPKMYIPRKLVTTPFIVSDGNSIIPLSETDVSVVQIKQSLMIVENKNTSCDNKDLSPILKVDLSKEGDVKVLPEDGGRDKISYYTYPADFDRSKAYIKKNFYGSTYEDFECGT